MRLLRQRRKPQESREEREAKRAQEQATTKILANGTKRSGKTFVSIKRTGDFEKDFESQQLY
jgi:hypothetical protein